MKRKLIISIVVFIIIISIIVFCYIKSINNNTSNFIDMDLIEQSHKQLNLGKDFTFAGFQKYREDSTYRYYYYFNKNTTVEININNNKVISFKVSIACTGSKFDRTEYSDCINILLAKNWFNFSTGEKADICSFVLNNNTTENINDVCITTFERDGSFCVVFLST